MHSLKSHIFGSYFISAVPITPGESVQRNLFDQKHIQSVWTLLPHLFCFFGVLGLCYDLGTAFIWGRGEHGWDFVGFLSF